MFCVVFVVLLFVVVFACLVWCELLVFVECFMCLLFLCV